MNNSVLSLLKVFFFFQFQGGKKFLEFFFEPPFRRMRDSSSPKSCPVASSPLWFILLSYPPSYIITLFSRGANRISSSLETRQGIKVHVARVHRWEYEKNGVKTVRQERRREKDGTHISRDGGRSFARKGWWSSGRTLKLYILISAQCSLAHKPISFFTLSLLRFRIWLSSSFYYFVQPRSRSRPLSYPAPSSFCFLSLLRMDDR